MTKLFLLAGALLAATFASAASPLAGYWDKDGVPFAELRADGKGSVNGEAVSWKSDARTLTLRYDSGKVDTMLYLIQGKALTIILGGQAAVYTRGKKASSPKGGKAPADKAGKDSLSKLLTSSAWCSFTYNQISGASHQERVVFRADGSWGSGAQAESYSSGAGGTVAGQSNSASGGRWRANGAALFMSRGGGPLEDVGLSVSRNSNGYPILKTGSKEYSSCR